MCLVRTLISLTALSLPAITAYASPFTAGEFLTYEPVDYGNRGEIEVPAASALLEDNYNTVIAPVTGLFQVGIPGPAGYSMTFDSADAVIAYLPGGGANGPLIADLLDPVSILTPFVGGELVGATLNVDLSYAGLLAHAPGVALGDLVFQNMDTLVGDILFVGQTVPFGPELATLDGVPVHEVLSDADLYLGGAASPFTDYEMLAALRIVDNAFLQGNVNDDADYLALPPTAPPAVPEPNSLALLGCGLIAVLVTQRQRFRRILLRDPC